jgi:hypothetical protein
VAMAAALVFLRKSRRVWRYFMANVYGSGVWGHTPGRLFSIDQLEFG